MKLARTGRKQFLRTMSSRHDCSPSRGQGSNPPHGTTFLPLNTFTLESWNPSPVRTLDGCTFQPGKARVSFDVLSPDSIALMRRARGRKALRSPGRCNLYREVRQMHRRSLELSTAALFSLVTDWNLSVGKTLRAHCVLQNITIPRCCAGETRFWKLEKLQVDHESPMTPGNTISPMFSQYTKRLRRKTSCYPVWRNTHKIKNI